MNITEDYCSYEVAKLLKEKGFDEPCLTRYTREKVLDLPLKKEWYNMIESGVNIEEYREIKPYWIKRLFETINVEFTHYEKIDDECANFYCSNVKYLKDDFKGGGFRIKDYTHIRFRYGYTKRTMLFELKGITIGKGNTEWGAPEDKEVFILKLGDRIE